MKKLLLLLTCLCLAFAVTACGDDSDDDANTPAENNGDTNNGDTPGNNGDTNNGDTPGNNGDTNNGDTPGNNGDTNNDANNPANNDNNGGGMDDVEPGSPSDYDFNVPGSYIYDLDIELDSSVGADINGDGVPDNGLGTILDSLGGLLGDTDVNAELDNAIAEGSLSLGTTWPTFADGNVVDSQDVKLHFMLLDAAGDGSFTADAASFVEGSKTPLIRLSGGTVSGGTLNAGPTDFFLSIPLGEISLDIVVSDAQIAGDLSSDEGGIAMNNGSIAGAVSKDNIFEALNGFAAGECACLGLDEPLIDIAAGACAQADPSTCEAEENSTCATIASFCGTAVQLIGPLSDIDLDGDGSNDAISVYLHVEMQGANITGVTAE